MKKLVQLGYIVVFCLFVVGCSLPASTRPGLSVQLYDPISGRVVGLPAPDIFIRAGALGPAAADVTRMIFYANGLVIGEDPSPVFQGGFTAGIMHWYPTEPGEYLVQAEALRTDGSAFSAAARVCVLPESDLLHPLTYFGYGYTGPCEIPTPDPSAPPGLEVTMAARAIPASLAYDFECPAALASSTIAFEATLNDPSNRVVFVVVDYSVPDRGGSSFPAGDSILLNWTSSSATGEKIFTGTTVDLTQNLRDEFEGDGGILTWTARAYGRSGEDLALDGPHEILASPCVAAVIGVPMLIIVEPTATLTPTLVPVVVPTKKPAGGDDGDGGGDGGGGSQTCSSYGDKDSCSAAGCSWDANKNTCN